jgi:hypothetical protein
MGELTKQDLKKWRKFLGEESMQPSLVCGGDRSYERDGVRVWGWQDWDQITPSTP